MSDPPAILQVCSGGGKQHGLGRRCFLPVVALLAPGRFEESAVDADLQSVLGLQHPLRLLSLLDHDGDHALARGSSRLRLMKYLAFFRCFHICTFQSDFF